jgi:hypothetical protein
MLLLGGGGPGGPPTWEAAAHRALMQDAGAPVDVVMEQAQVGREARTRMHARMHLSFGWHACRPSRPDLCFFLYRFMLLFVSRLGLGGPPTGRSCGCGRHPVDVVMEQGQVGRGARKRTHERAHARTHRLELRVVARTPCARDAHGSASGFAGRPAYPGSRAAGHLIWASHLDQQQTCIEY